MRPDRATLVRVMQKLRGDPRRLEVFVRAVELGSFSALARAWQVKPSSVSRQVGHLEEALGVRLLARTTRQLRLTDAGAQLYERARVALDDLDEAMRSAAEYAATPRGHLRLSTPVAFGRRYVAPLIAPFLGRFPNLQLEVAFHDRFVDLVGEGYDVALRAGHIRDEGLVARRLAPNDRVVVASRDYLRRRGRPETPDAIADHDALVFQYVDATDVWRFRRNGEVSEVRVRGRLASNNGDLLLRAAVDGAGVALVPRWLAAEALAAHHVEAVLTDFEVTATDFDSHLHVLYPSRRFLPANVRVLLAYLYEQFAPPPWMPNDI